MRATFHSKFSDRENFTTASECPVVHCPLLVLEGGVGVERGISPRCHPGLCGRLPPPLLDWELGHFNTDSE